jgi:hypothetical protein
MLKAGGSLRNRPKSAKGTWKDGNQKAHQGKMGKIGVADKEDREERGLRGFRGWTRI